jgi:2-oxoglutarate dehydrogenase E2 component (dihydrolipoamide succinyltransferase)
MQILMPQLGETVTEGTIVIWHRREGDVVAADDLLFEIETDKVATEVTAPAAGVLSRVLVTAGQTVPVGTLLAEISVTGATAVNESQGSSDAQLNPASNESQGSTDAQLNSASNESQGSTDAQLNSASSGSRLPSEQLGSRGRRLPRRDARGRPLSPAVRRLASEHNLDVAQLAGSGRDGRVRRRDVEQYLEGLQRLPNARTVAASSTSHASGSPTGGASQLIPFNRLRKRTAAHMVLSKATSPHVLQAVEVDFRAVLAVRNSIQQEWRARYGRSLTYLPFVAYAVCRTVADFPMINASVEGEALRVHDAVNLAVAVDLDFDGLVAPVIRNAQTLGVAALAHAIDDVIQRARAGKLTADDLKSGTYTISNSGSFGTLITAPIINQPQVAILSMDGIRKRAWVVEGPGGDSIAIRPIGVLAQSFDHRAVDGAYSAAFLRALKQRLESDDPEAWGRLTV